METNETLLDDVMDSIIEGDDQASAEATGAALDAGIDPLKILNEGLMAGADVVGTRFEAGEYFLPQLMLAGRALKAAMSLVEPVLQEKYADGASANRDTGTVVMATIQTDIHDIGKNIVASMLTASGFKVHDLGVDVQIKSIITKAQELDAHIIGCSALLTTSMPFMRDLINLLEAMGERDRFKVMVGGASVTPEFSEKIGADGTAANAVKAVQLAQQMIREQRVSEGASS